MRAPFFPLFQWRLLSIAHRLSSNLSSFYFFFPTQFSNLMKTCLIPCDGWSPWSLMGQCFQVQDLFVCSAHRTVRLASTCKASSASNILLGCPSYCELQRALTNTSLFCQTPASVLVRLTAIRVRNFPGSQSMGESKIKGWIRSTPSSQEWLLDPCGWLCFPVFFPLGHAEKIVWAHGANRQGHPKLKALGLEILGCPSPTGLAYYLGHVMMGGSAFQNSHRVKHQHSK